MTAPDGIVRDENLIRIADGDPTVGREREIVDVSAIAQALGWSEVHEASAVVDEDAVLRTEKQGARSILVQTGHAHVGQALRGAIGPIGGATRMRPA